MHTTESFAVEFEKLEKALHGFTPDDEPWYFPAVSKLMEDYSQQTIIRFAQGRAWPEYTFEILVKSGLRGIDKKVLLPYLDTDNDDNLYCTAFCLAACGFQDGFDILTQFANKTHPLSNNLDPFTEILPDLKFIDDPRVDPIRELCILSHKR